MHKHKVSVSGGCQCGAVRYHADAMLDNAHICHCRMCQKAVGNVFAALVAAPIEAFAWTRGEPSVFKSSELVERGFCHQCGTPLFYRGLNSKRINLTIGSLDQPENFAPKSQMGSEARLVWFEHLTALADDGVTGAGGNEQWATSIAASNRQHPDHDTDLWPVVGKN
ncbi:GFA family protein [Simiduia curdlanivorans]|uniref:GFA family protein n=1 Tax=Simiduia curdlanivorans TaxID=1492769 RepID=A0ABV8V8G0_9GAMM|nr:GFA family protein [Simiduia curdlanivorans]MDN3638832.1 GFA family protein [Simiduia curdlanivorans]